jgi:hypothetical protein
MLPKSSYIKSPFLGLKKEKLRGGHFLNLAKKTLKSL